MRSGFWLSTLLLLGLTGCGEDQSQPSSATSQPDANPGHGDNASVQPNNGYDGSDQRRFVGVAMDGYLYRARVCLDSNDNALCDGDEYRTETDRQGRYVLLVPADSDASQVLVEVQPGITVDMDEPQQPLSQSVWLRPLASASGEQLVTPLTTLIRQRAQQLGIGEQQAQQQLASEWLVPAGSLSGNYLQDIDGAMDGVIHDIAQVVFDDWQQQLQVSQDNNPGASWSHVSAQAMRQWHSSSGQKQLLKKVQARDMAAAPELVVNDDQDWLSWSWVDDFSTAEAYEYSIDGGHSWVVATQKPIAIGNRNLAAGQVQLRVRAGKDGGAGRIGRSPQAFSARLSDIAAPSELQLNDIDDEFSWSWVAGFERAEDYEISLDGGASWTPATANPSAYHDLDLAPGQLQVRVSASTERLAGAAVVSSSAFTQLKTNIAAPTQLSVDDVNNTLGWRAVSGYRSANLYELSVDGGYSWQAVSANPADVGDIDVAVGQAQLRVAAKAGVYAAGAVASNSEAFHALLSNIAAPSQLLVDDRANLLDWTLVSGFTSLDDYQVSLDGGLSWQRPSRKPLPVGDRYLPAGQVQVRVVAIEGQRLPGQAAYNQSDFQASLSNIEAPTQLSVDDDNDTLNWQPVAGYPSASHYEWRIQGQQGWRRVGSRPLLVGDIAIAKGQLQLRVAANNSHRSGELALSPAAFTALPSNIAAPSMLSVDDVQNRLSWRWVSGFEQANLYEYHLGDGQWQTAFSNPLEVGDIDLPMGALHLRVAAQSGQHRAGASASSPAAFTQLQRLIPAPTGLLADDVADSLNWQWLDDYQQASDYEWSVDGGQNWSVVTSKPLLVGDRDIAANQLQLRVKAILGLRESGAVATSPDDFNAQQSNIAAPTQIKADDNANQLSWHWVEGYDQASDYQYSINGGISWLPITRMPQPVGDIEATAQQVRLRVKALAGIRAAGRSGSPEQGFSRQAGTPAAPTALQVNDSADTLDWAWVNGYSDASDYEYQWPGSQGWQPVQQKPLALGNVSIASGQLLLRVAAKGAQAPGAISVNDEPFTIAAASLPAPANLVVDDANDTLDWDFVAGYDQAQNYQLRLAADGEWQAVTSKPVQLSDTFDGVVSVRIAIDGAPLATTAAGAYSISAFAKFDQQGQRLANDASDWLCVKDNRYSGGLYWLQSTSNSLYWQGGSDNVLTRLESAKQQVLCGFSDWQVAGIEQLLHLKDEQVWGQAPFFAQLSSNRYQYYWSSDEGDNAEERRVLSGGDSRQTYSQSTRPQYDRAYLQLNRLRVDPLFYLAQIKQQLATAVTLTQQVTTWNNDAQSTGTQRQQEFESANSIDDIQLLQAKLLDSIKKQQDRYGLLPDLLQQQQQVLALAQGRGQRLIDDPDHTVSDAQRLDYQQELQSLALQVEQLQQAVSAVDGIAAVLADMQTLLASLKMLTDELDRWQQIKTLQQQATSQLEDAQSQADHMAQALQALQQAGMDSEKAMALYLAARQSMADMASSVDYQTQLQQQHDWLSEWHTQLSHAALPSAVLNDLQQQILAIKQLMSEQQGFRQSQQPASDAALDAAYAGGLAISAEQASIDSAGFSFIKLDHKGRFMLSTETLAQGWRCVQDQRFADRVWLLLQHGQAGSLDDMNYPQAQAQTEQANQQQLCGRNDWQIPSIQQLKTLKLVDIGAYQPAIDVSVFPRHRGADEGYQSSDLLQRYFYWSRNNADPGQRYGYSFSSFYDYQRVSELQQGLDASEALDSSYQTMLRLVADGGSQDRFDKLAVDGQITSDDSEWVCSRQKSSGLIWLRTGFVPQPGEARDLNQQQMEVARVTVCGSQDWRLPTLAELQTMLPYQSGELGQIELANNRYYATSSTIANQYGSLYPAGFTFEAGLEQRLSSSTDTYSLWVSDQQDGAAKALDEGFTGLDNNGEPTLSGVHYCVRDDNSGAHWTTHLASGDSQNEYRSPSSYCGVARAQWRYPSFQELKQALLPGNKNNLLSDWINGGDYWLARPGSTCQDTQWAVMDSNGIERCIDGTSWSNSPKESNYSRFISTP